LFEAANPGITIKYDSSVSPVGVGGFEDKITSALATGTAPDVFSVISPQATRIIAKGQLAPIDDAALKALGYDSIDALKATRIPGAFDAWTDDAGNVYGIPDGISSYTMYCNSEQLKAGGVDPATLSIKTWDDFLAVGKKVIAANPTLYKNSSGEFVKNFFKLPMYQDDTWSMQTLTQFLAESGGSVLSADGKSSTINSPEAVRAVSMMMTLSRELGNPNIGASVPGEMFGGFSAGDQTCIVSGEWMYGAFLLPSKSPLLGNYTAYILPRLDADKVGNVFWGWSFVVNAASANKEAAWKYIGELAADPNAQIAAVGVWPPAKDLASMQAVKDTPYGDIIAANTEGGQHIFKALKYTDIARVLRGKLEVLAFEGGPVQAALDDAAQQITIILQQ
jgi:lactose/L-arabinose transport system substrate-binding protein